mgnify:CR=1 FL=1
MLTANCPRSCSKIRISPIFLFFHAGTLKKISALLRVLSVLVVKSLLFSVVKALALKSASLFSFVLSRGTLKKSLVLLCVLSASVVKSLALIREIPSFCSFTRELKKKSLLFSVPSVCSVVKSLAIIREIPSFCSFTREP